MIWYRDNPLQRIWTEMLGSVAAESIPGLALIYRSDSIWKLKIFTTYQVVSMKTEENIDIVLHIGKKLKITNHIRNYMRNLQTSL